MSSFLDAWVKPVNWSGQVIAANNFPTATIAADTALLQSWTSYQAQQTNAFNSARDFLLASTPAASANPASYLARISQPVVNNGYAHSLGAVLQTPAIKPKFDGFTCDQNNVLSAPLKDLLCFGVLDNASVPPVATRWKELLNAPLIGPQAARIMDSGITLATIADFAQTDRRGAFVFVPPQEITNFQIGGLTADLKGSIGEQKGVGLLHKLQWLAEAQVIQQSVAYGDYTAGLVEKTLYDPTSRTLTTDPAKLTPLQQQALAAMRTNPVLARNVVMLAMRQAISDANGGDDKADSISYEETYYTLAFNDLIGSQACSGASLPRQKFANMFPNWPINYWVTEEQVKNDSTLAACPKEVLPDPTSNGPAPPAQGSGVAVTVSDFHVLLPPPLVLAEGDYEQADSLRFALLYRDRINQAIIDRNLLDTLKAVVGARGLPSGNTPKMAFGLLNRGWNWQPQK